MLQSGWVRANYWCLSPAAIPFHMNIIIKTTNEISLLRDFYLPAVSLSLLSKDGLEDDHSETRHTPE